MNTPIERPLLLLRQSMEAPRLETIAEGLVAAYSRGQPGAERENQDGLALVPLGPGRGVLAIADGVGGHALGGEAAALVLTTLCEEVPRTVATGGTVRSAILDAMEKANAGVVGLGGGAASTVAVVEIDGSTIRSYHAGDSEILVVGQRGKVRLQVVPHSPTGYAVEAGFLAEREALDHEDRHLVSNVVGSQAMRTDLSSAVPLRKRDTVLLATDGLVDNLHVHEIVEIVRKGPLEGASRELVRRVHERMATPQAGQPSKPDDLTFVLFRRSALGRAVPPADPRSP